MTTDTKISDHIGKDLEVLRCWCGGQVSDSIHPSYSQCLNCRTFVLTEQLDSKGLEDFYTFGNYWHTLAVEVKKFPPIEQRAINDFNDRIPVWYHLLRQLVSKYRPKPNLLLEIGCAHGGFLHYCRENGLENVVGNEPDEKTCQFARQHFGLPHIFSGLFPDVDMPFDEFGVVLGFDVVEHFSDPVRALRKVKDLLSDDGIFLFQIPCYRGENLQWPQFKPPEHIFLYDSENIRSLYATAGLEIGQIIPGCFAHDMFVMGRKKQ